MLIYRFVQNRDEGKKIKMKKYSSSLHSFSLRSFPSISVALKCNELYTQIAKCFLLLNLGISSALLNATVLPEYSC